MKPTKEQLADPKWWDDNSKGYDYVYETGPRWDGHNNCKNTVEFAGPDGYISERYSLVIDSNAWQLLAKRPEPEQWRPEVGEMCEVWVENAEYWAKITVLAVDKDTIVWRNGTDRKSYRGTRISDARPTKTQREELIDLIYMSSEIELDAAAATASIILGKYDLTEKDGE